MGFIACFITPLLLGVEVVWLSPFEWVANPALLLDAVSRHRATLAWLPNFAFRVSGAASQGRAGPIRSVELAVGHQLLGAGQPGSDGGVCRTVSPDDGLSPAALATCYAMAENVFAVTTSSADCPPRYRRVDRAVWHNHHRSEVVDARRRARRGPRQQRPAAWPTAKCASWPTTVASLPAGEAGQILIRSSFLFTGYFRRDDLNTALFDDEGFFNTGDLGYRRRGRASLRHRSGQGPGDHRRAKRLSAGRRASRQPGERRACRPRGFVRRADARTGHRRPGGAGRKRRARGGLGRNCRAGSHRRAGAAGYRPGRRSRRAARQAAQEHERKIGPRRQPRVVFKWYIWNNSPDHLPAE